MKIQPITHNTLAETVASKLAVSLLDGSLVPGSQLPSERELMNQLSRNMSLWERMNVIEKKAAVSLLYVPPVFRPVYASASVQMLVGSCMPLTSRT